MAQAMVQCRALKQAKSHVNRNTTQRIDLDIPASLTVPKFHGKRKASGLRACPRKHNELIFSWDTLYERPPAKNGVSQQVISLKLEAGTR